jgi:hypothetical protein
MPLVLMKIHLQQHPHRSRSSLKICRIIITITLRYIVQGFIFYNELLRIELYSDTKCAINRRNWNVRNDKGSEPVEAEPLCLTASVGC